MPPPRIPRTLRTQMLSERMRELRERRDMTLKQAAPYIEVEFSTLARYERAEWPFPKRYVVDLLDVYGVHEGEERDELICLASNVAATNHWHRAIRPSRHQSSDGGELLTEEWIADHAEWALAYAPMTPPPFLQTESYAFHTLRREKPDLAVHKIQAALARLLKRQETLVGRRSLRLGAVIEESVLHRTVGDAEVHREQLSYLAKTIRAGNIAVKVLRTSAGLHQGADGAFTVYRLPPPHMPVAVVRHLTGWMVLEEYAATPYVNAYTQLVDMALTPPESAELIEKHAVQLK